MELFELLRQMLFPCYMNSVQSHVIVRCPYCGDSQKNSSKGHFYIRSEEPHVYFCQKCEARGLLTLSVLDELQVTDASVRKYIRTSTLKRRGPRSIGEGASDNRIRISQPLNPRLYTVKKQYVANRLGLSIDDPLITQQFRMIPGLTEILQNNPEVGVIHENLKLNKADNRDFNDRVAYLDSNYVGFINHDVSHLTFRRFTENRYLPRYRNVILHRHGIEHNNSFSVFYGSYNKLTNPVINLGEGIITMAGAYILCQKPDEIWISGNSKSGLSQSLRWVARQGFVNSPLIIWSDSEIKRTFWETFVKRNRVVRVLPSVIVNYNVNGDDFGYTRDQIKTQSFILKGRHV